MVEVKDAYGIEVSNLEFLPIDETSWGFLAESDKGKLFIKLIRNALYFPLVEISSLISEKLYFSFVVPAIST